MELLGQTEKQNSDLPKRIGIIHSEVKREYFPTEAQYVTEKEAEHNALKIAAYIEKMGIEAIVIPGNENLSENLKSSKPEMVFNLVDSVKGYEYVSASIPGILEILDIPYTGADILGLALTYNKFLVKKLLQQAGIPVPNSQLFTTPNDPLDINMRFPLMSKLNEIHGAVEITADSISENEKHLRDRLKFLIDTYKQPIIVEEYIAGREITCYVLEGMNRKVYLAEKVFEGEKLSDKYVFTTFADQWETKVNPFKYQKLDDNVLRDYVKKAFDVVKMMDYAKFDVRLDASGRYYFVDANANPEFGPKELDTAMGYIIEDLYGIPFPQIVKRLIVNTLKGPIGDYNPTNGFSNSTE